jgi:replicative DNA helicase
LDFSLSFQLRLLLVCYTDKEFYFLSKELLKKEFFNSIFCQWLFEYLEQYVDKYKGLPTVVVIEQELINNNNVIILPEEENLVNEFLELLKKHDKAELVYIKDTFLKFAKSKSIKSILNDVSEYIDDGDFGEVFSSLKQAERKFDLLNSTERDKNLFSLLNLKEIYESKGGIKTGISLIDNVVGGLSPKELSVVLADTNVGKSLYMVHLGGSAVKQMRKVLHVTLEMSFARTLARYLANLSEDEDDISYVQIVNLDPADKIINYVHDKLHDKYEGYLEVVEFPTGKCGIQDLYNLLDKYPDTELLVVDYLQIMKPSKRRDQLRFELTDLAVGLRGIASENKIHVTTGAQANKTASNRRIIGKELTSEDYGIMRVADIGIGMGQNRDDALKNEVVLNLTRSRNSEKHTVERYFIDFKRMRLLFRRQELLAGDHSV